jgi:hypothetical protein
MTDVKAEDHMQILKNTNNQQCFELGLVMAGAISAGAYTAGVLDFLIQALDEWYAAKQQKSGKVPPHEVKINVISGASAGGMNSAIMTSALFSKFSHVTGKEPTDESDNPFYNTWVRDIDIKPLLGHEDLKADKPVVSVLDSTVLEQIANRAIKINTRQDRNYVSEKLRLHLTVSNLRGVPYQVDFKGNNINKHGYLLYRDYMSFDVYSNGSKRENYPLPLDPANLLHANWEKLKKSALTTGAFPVGLAPREVNRIKPDYSFYFSELKPAWQETPEEYTFLGVDGGLFNNEPLGIALKDLRKGATENNREPDKANRALIKNIFLQRIIH